MKAGRIFFILAALIIVFIVGFLAWRLFLAPMLGGGDGVQVVQSTPVVDTIDIVVVAQQVARGQVFDTSVLAIVPIQRSFYNDSMFTSIEMVAGKTARVDLESGTPLTAGMVVESGNLNSGSDWALQIPRGMVAVSIPINRLSSISYAPERGDHVNVIVTLLLVDLDSNFQTRLPNLSAGVIGPGGTVLVGPIESNDQTTSPNLMSSEYLSTQSNQSVSGATASPIGISALDPAFSQPFYMVPSEPQRPRQVSQTLIQNAVVLQMGTFGEQRMVEEVVPEDQAATPQETPTVVQEPEEPDIITLIVTPQDAVTLNYLVFAGARLTLVGRGATDDSLAETESVTLQFLLDQYNISVPAKLPYGEEPRNNEAAWPVLNNDIIAPTQTP